MTQAGSCASWPIRPRDAALEAEGVGRVRAAGGRDRWAVAVLVLGERAALEVRGGFTATIRDSGVDENETGFGPEGRRLRGDADEGNQGGRDEPLHFAD